MFSTFHGYTAVVVVQSPSRVQLSVISWTAARQASLSFTISLSLLRLMSIESVMPSILSSVVPFFSCPLSFLASRYRLFKSDDQSIRASASASILLMNIQCWYPLGLTDLITLLSKELSRVFSSTTVRKHQFFSAQPSLWSNSPICTWLLEKP